MSNNSVSIVGSGHTKFGRLDNLTLEELIVSAAKEAIQEAEISAGEIDAVYLGHFNSGMVPDGFPSSLIHQVSPDLRFKPATRCENACASGAAAVFAGIAAIESGQADLVLVVGAESMTPNSTSEVTSALGGAGYQNDPEEAKLSFPDVFAIAAQSYGDKYQSPLEAMAAIAAKNHENALSNPLAHMQREMSFDACNQVSDKNPIISTPLRLTDCSLITDGAAAIILASSERAKSFSKQVTFCATSHVSDFLPLSSRDFVAFEGPEKAIQQAITQGGISLDDLDFAEVHDCFTIAELLIYEAMGLAIKGEGHRALDEGMVQRGGKLPINLSGGLKAKGHPVGATGVSMHAISFRQLTGQAGDMQCPGANLGLVFNMGGAGVANYATILEAQRV